ncbi:hypothetical protein L208DRAFT_1235927 [Tricholoma matsutake]|nr:hypothetical protein L208DRAFT_1235927 [Tricholoma matsutake 945]
MRQFAAVAALLCINGHNPMPLSPAVILFIMYRTDPHCLTPAFIGEWFVNLQKWLLNWLAMGPGGNLQPFAGYFAFFCISLQVLAYQHHDYITHQAITVDMLYTATLGPASYWHPEQANFIAAFDLPCHNGFRFTKASTSSR